MRTLERQHTCDDKNIERTANNWNELLETSGVD